MKTSRRKFMMNSAVLGVAGYAASTIAEEATSVSDISYKLVPIGKVEIKDGAASVRLFDTYVDGLLGLEEWSHVQVIYWFDKTLHSMARPLSISNRTPRQMHRPKP